MIMIVIGLVLTALGCWRYFSEKKGSALFLLGCGLLLATSAYSEEVQSTTFWPIAVIPLVGTGAAYLLRSRLSR